MVTRWTTFFLLFPACQPTSSEKDSDPADTTPDTAGDTGDASVVTITDLDADIHDEMGSIVELTWEQTGSGSIMAEYSVDEGEWLQTPTWTLGEGSQRVLLLGIPFDTEVTWRLLLNGEPVEEDDTIDTDEAPSGLPLPSLLSGDSDRWDPDTRYVLTCMAPRSGSSSAWSVILDRQARPVWALQNPAQRTSFQTQLSYNKDTILIDHNSFWGAFDGGANSQVAEVNIEGETLTVYDTPGMAHPFTQLPDGSIVWGRMASSGGFGYIEDLWVVSPAGDDRELFACEEFLDNIGATAENCGSNSISWDDASQTILYSLYSTETVLDLTPDGELRRYFGHLPGAWGFQDEDTAFWWQHGAHYLPDGHLLLSSRLTDTAEETVIREYTLDETAQELVEVWSFGQDEGVYAYIMGEARRLGNGNSLHNYGYNPRFREATPKGEVVWDISWSSEGTVGHIATLSDLYGLWAPE